jgi:hypothetical protein
VTPAAPRPVFHFLASKPVFRVGEQVYCWDDVVLAARRWGDWADLVREVREGVACIRHMLGTEKPPAEADEDAAATQFRSVRKLLTAEAAEAWLDERGVSVDNWLRYIRRTLLRERCSADLPELVARYPARPDQVRRGLHIVGVCAGHLMRFACKLAGRAAIFARSPKAAEPEAAGDNAGPILLGLSHQDCRAKLAHLGAVERSYQAFADEVVTQQAIRNHITGRYTDWIQVEYCSAIFPSQEAADEAVLCVREDGAALHDVARDCKLRAIHRTAFLEELHPKLRGLLFSAKKQELLGPMPAEGGFKLCMLLAKTPPAFENEKVHARAREWLAATAANLEATARVRWECQL